jgi:hypothetical protein
MERRRQQETVPMNIINQEQYDALPLNERGARVCPGETDYSGVTQFGSNARFGNDAQFGSNARFEKLPISKQGNPLVQFDRFGSVNRVTQFFNTVEGVWVRCGCQLLTLSKFRERVILEHGDGGHGVVYLMIADVAETYFKLEDARNVT